MYKAGVVTLLFAITVAIVALFSWERSRPIPHDSAVDSANKMSLIAATNQPCPNPCAGSARPANGRSSVSIADMEDEDESNRTPAEKQLAADIERALDEEDFELAKRCAPLAMNCKDVEIRSAMVDTLGWFGEQALPELTPFIADSNEDVAENAMSEWESAVSSIQDDKVKIGVVEMAMQAISNEDALESISGEYIGVDEKLAVESLLRIIEGGGSARGVSKAKETYEFVTGDEFVDRATAEKWISEEYTPQED